MLILCLIAFAAVPFAIWVVISILKIFFGIIELILGS